LAADGLRHRLQFGHILCLFHGVRIECNIGAEDVMAEQIRKLDYYYVSVPDKPGEAARILTALHQGGGNLLGFSGFPEGARKAQLDFVPEDSKPFLQIARRAGLKLSRKRACFLVQGDDQHGVVAAVFARLAAVSVNVISMQAIAAGAGRFAGILWVKPEDTRKASKALGAV
jgi:predicted amino acid-binding ACT domain protein